VSTRARGECPPRTLRSAFVSATTILSAIGLFFAAVAAWGAWQTVRLTRQMRREEGHRRLVAALLEVQHAAEDLTVRPTDLERQDRFREAQRELTREGVMGIATSASSEDLRRMPRLLASLTAPDAQQQPGQVAENAKAVVVAVTSKPEPTKWQRRRQLLRWVPMYLRHPRRWAAITEHRRGWTAGPGE